MLLGTVDGVWLLSRAHPPLALRLDRRALVYSLDNGMLNARCLSRRGSRTESVRMDGVSDNVEAKQGLLTGQRAAKEDAASQLRYETQF